MDEEDLSFRELAETQGEPKQSAEHGRRRAPRRGGFLRRTLPVLLVLLVVGGLAYGGFEGYRWITSNVSVENEAQDFEGPGHGEVEVEVASGDTGAEIANTLVEQGVIKATGPFVNLFSNTPDASTIEPGIYSLRLEMTSADALNALMDPSNLAGHRVIIPEGKRLSEIWEVLAAETEIPVEDFEAAAEDYTSYGVPENEAGSLEGYLWPGRYDIYEDDSAEDVIATMWSRMEEQLTAREIPEDQWHRTLTIASLAEMEVRRPEDYGKVVRTIENRLEGVGEANGSPMKLQFDSTVHYATGKSGSVATTDEERASDDPYNTYRHAGLPPGPIASPGAGALDAAVDPPAGDWLYFVSVNGETGETKFAATWAEHTENVEEWQAWEAAN
ncbi:ABC transporter substrate-binding protein [Brachybacterium vulturis]|uniref:Endolytic murein transglycosylase n=1 Tax=Brachybacterium vulturis TaxID=2017484 RepID=A0A291GPN1_9MICO|nr:endolytic transglycosylase MltG [Brachybacterium vulturis]ATG51946.1 ABC transporter substrate-binding protein [Brachybacterium vulturis]